MYRAPNRLATGWAAQLAIPPARRGRRPGRRRGRRRGPPHAGDRPRPAVGIAPRGLDDAAVRAVRGRVIGLIEEPDPLPLVEDQAEVL